VGNFSALATVVRFQVAGDGFRRDSPTSPPVQLEVRDSGTVCAGSEFDEGFCLGLISVTLVLWPMPEAGRSSRRPS